LLETADDPNVAPKMIYLYILNFIILLRHKLEAHNKQKEQLLHLCLFHQNWILI